MEDAKLLEFLRDGQGCLTSEGQEIRTRLEALLDKLESIEEAILAFESVDTKAAHVARLHDSLNNMNSKGVIVADGLVDKTLRSTGTFFWAEGQFSLFFDCLSTEPQSEANIKAALESSMESREGPQRLSMLGDSSADEKVKLRIAALRLDLAFDALGVAFWKSREDSLAAVNSLLQHSSYYPDAAELMPTM